MHRPANPKLIQLSGLAKSYPAAGTRPSIVLQPTTLAVPADRRVAVLGKRRQGKSVFLRILAGAEKPTRGEVISRLRLSPVLRSGALFHGRISALENVRFFARMLDIDADRLALAIDGFYGPAGVFGRSPNGDEREKRRAAEIALLSLLPFDCYLIDDIGQLPEEARSRHLDTAAQRRAGIIFATNQPQLARRYADCAVVIRDGILHPFSDVAEAIAFDER